MTRLAQRQQLLDLQISNYVELDLVRKSGQASIDDSLVGQDGTSNRPDDRVAEAQIKIFEVGESR